MRDYRLPMNALVGTEQTGCSLLPGSSTKYVSNWVAVVDNRVGGVVCLDNLVVGLRGPVAKQRSLLSTNYGEWEKIGEINI